MAEVKIEKKKDHYPGELCCSDEYYPYGTSLDFDEEILEGLGIFDQVVVDDEVTIIATAKITRKSENIRSDSDGEEVNKSISFQLTTVSVNPKTAVQPSLTDRLYRG